MATASKIYIDKTNTGLLRLPQTDEAAELATRLLQRDHDTHHVFFNTIGYHNHLSHQILAHFGAGSSPAKMTAGYDQNTHYQLPLNPYNKPMVKMLYEWPQARQFYGEGTYYAEILAYFREIVDSLGWKAALQKALFAGTERSEDLLYRMFTGIFHPMIQLMYGIEWEQPAIIAMALAQAAVHSPKETKFLQEASELFSRPTSWPQCPANMTLEDLYRTLAPALSDVHEEDLRMQRAIHGDAYYSFMTRFHERLPRVFNRVAMLVPPITPENIREKTVEMFYVNILQAASPAARVFSDFAKEPRIDFHLMHHVNVSPIFVLFSECDWIPWKTKVHMLQLKTFCDMIEYAARLFPPLDYDAIRAYKPRDGDVLSPHDFLERMSAIEDDGHCIKLARSLLICKQKAMEFDGRPWMKFSEHDWLQVASIFLDATEHVDSTHSRWIRGAGHLMSYEKTPIADWVDREAPRKIETWWDDGEEDAADDNKSQKEIAQTLARIQELKKKNGKWPYELTREWYL